MSGRGGNSFLQYMMAQRGARQRTGFDQPNPPPPNVQMTGDAGLGVPQPTAPINSATAQAAPSPQPQQGMVAATPQAGMPMAPTEPSAMDMPFMTPNSSYAGVSPAQMADEAWAENFYQVSGRWPTSFEYQLLQTQRDIQMQTGRPASRNELIMSTMARILAPPPRQSQFEEVPQQQPPASPY